MGSRVITVLAIFVCLPIAGASAAGQSRWGFVGSTKAAKPRTTRLVQDAAAKAIRGDLARELPAAALPLYLDYTKAVVGHLQEKLHQPLTIPGLLRAKGSALEFCAKEGWLASMTRTVLEDMGQPQTSVDRMIRQAARDVPRLVKHMQGLSNQLEQQNALDVPQVAKEIGLNRANRKSLQRGELTLADVFTTQPDLIINNSE